MLISPESYCHFLLHFPPRQRHRPHQFVNEPRMIMMFSFAFKNSSLIDFNYLNSLTSKLRFLFIAFL